MHAIFMARGPLIAKGKTLKSVNMIDLYNLFCYILNFKCDPTQGSTNLDIWNDLLAVKIIKPVHYEKGKHRNHWIGNSDLNQKMKINCICLRIFRVLLCILCGHEHWVKLIDDLISCHESNETPHCTVSNEILRFSWLKIWLFLWGMVILLNWKC